MPALEQLHNAMGDEVAVIGVNTDDRLTSARNFLSDTRVTYPTGYDPRGAVADAYRLFGMPTTVFVSEDGHILEKVNGEVSSDDLAQRVRRYAGREMPPSPAPGDSLSVPRRGGLVGLIDRTNVGVAGSLVLVAIAFAFGAVHALGPGHGKTLMAAYVVGAEGKARDAVLLGTIVSAMHTASVIVLGIVLLTLDRPLEGNTVYHGISLLLGVVVAGVGIRLLTWQLSDVGRGSTESPAAHLHKHVSHSHIHHLPAGVKPVSRKGLVALAVSGGVFPSPSALILLVTAVTVNRTALGLALIAAFSLGLAVTLSAVGLCIIYGRNIVERRGHVALARLLPLLGGSWLLVMGSVLTIRSAMLM